MLEVAGRIAEKLALVLELLGIRRGERMGTITLGNEIVIVGAIRIEHRNDRLSTWVGNGAGGQTLVAVRVVRIVDLGFSGLNFRPPIFLIAQQYTQLLGQPEDTRSSLLNQVDSGTPGRSSASRHHRPSLARRSKPA